MDGIGYIPWKVGMSLIWIWCLFFKSLNSCFRHLKAWGLHLQEIRIVNCNWSSNEQTEVWTRWLQTVRDLKLESFSKISLEKVWKGERWVSNTEISFERLWTLLVDVVLRVFLLVSNFSVYLLAEILVILLIYCIWWCHSFNHEFVFLNFGFLKDYHLGETQFNQFIQIFTISKLIHEFIRFPEWISPPKKKWAGDGESEVWHRLCALQHGLAEVERWPGILASNGWGWLEDLPRNSRSLKKLGKWQHLGGYWICLDGH